MTQYLDIEVFALEIGALGFKVRDYGLLGSALSRPKTAIFGREAYPTLELKAAALVHSLIRNHPMFDGNKRVAWLALNAFLYINGFTINCTPSAGLSLILGLAKDDENLQAVADWISHRLINF